MEHVSSLEHFFKRATMTLSVIGVALMIASTTVVEAKGPLNVLIQKEIQSSLSEERINYGLRVSYSDPSGIYFTGTYEYVDLDQQPEISALRLIGGYKF